jgi:alpha-ribazole phosphatase
MAKFVTKIVPADQITRVYLIRHGAVGEEWNDRVYGQMDVPLSEKGRSQADALSERMADMSLDAVYASDLSRAVETAARVARAHDLSVETVSALREASFGHWQGVEWSDILDRFADEVRARQSDVAGAKMEDGESLVELQSRVMPAVGEIVKRHRGESVAIATHGGVTRVVIADALGLDLAACIRIEQSHCCLNKLDYYPDGVVVRLMNG